MNKESFNSRESIEIGKIHPDFKIVTGSWAFNRFKSVADGEPVLKMRAGFDDVSALDGIALVAKIGENTDSSIAHKFVLFAYASDKQAADLEALAERMPQSEIITNLGKGGVSTPQSSVRIIKAE